MSTDTIAPSTSTPLPLISGRPAVVVRDGCRIFVNIHDAEYLRQRREWRRKLRAHPDTGGTSSTFRDVFKAYRAWEASETRWYAAIGLEPPTNRPEKASAPDVLHGDVARFFDVSYRARLVMQAHPHYTSQELAAALGISVPHASVLRCRARRQSHRKRKTDDVLALLLDGHARTDAEIVRQIGSPLPQLPKLIMSLRRRGFEIERVITSIGPRRYRLSGIPALKGQTSCESVAS